MLRLLSIAFRDGGWGMWVICALGVIGVGAAARFCWRGDRSLLGPVRWWTVALITSGCFGFLGDLHAVIQYSTVGLDELYGGRSAVTADQRVYAVLEGLNESLYCLSSTFLFTVLIALLVAVGWGRSPLAGGWAAHRKGQAASF
jgi:hypothetical protein